MVIGVLPWSLACKQEGWVKNGVKAWKGLPPMDDGGWIKWEPFFRIWTFLGLPGGSTSENAAAAHMHP